MRKRSIRIEVNHFKTGSKPVGKNLRVYCFILNSAGIVCYLKQRNLGVKEWNAALKVPSFVTTYM